MRKSDFKIDWLNHALEFFVVIIGILIAFQLNTYAENKKQQNTLNNHRAFLLEETETNKKTLGYAQKYVSRSIKTLDSLRNEIESEGDLTKINELARNLLDYSGYFYVQKNAYNTLKDSGDIRFLEFEERKNIVSLYGYYLWTESVQNESFEGVEAYYDYLESNIELYKSDLPKREIFETLEFSNILGTYRYLLHLKQEKYKDCEEVIKTSLEKQSKYL